MKTKGRLTFDGEMTVNELVEFLMEYSEGSNGIRGITELEGKYEGFAMEVVIAPIEDKFDS